MWFNGGSGQTLYDPWTMAMFNILFTSFPILLVAVFDSDVRPSTLLRFPIAYRQGPQAKKFNRRRAMLWVLEAVFHSALAYFAAMMIFRQDILLSSGKTLDIWSFGWMVYGSVLMTVSLKIALETHTWTVWHFVAVAGSIAAWFVWTLLLSVFDPSDLPAIASPGNTFYVAYHLLRTAGVWMCFLLVPVVALLPDITYKVISRTWYPEPVHILQEFDSLHKHCGHRESAPSICHLMDEKTPLVAEEGREVPKYDATTTASTTPSATATSG